MNITIQYYKRLVRYLILHLPLVRQQLLYFKMDDVKRVCVCDILETNGFDCEVVEAFRDNKVDWEVFTQLSKDDIRESGVTTLGDRKITATHY